MAESLIIAGVVLLIAGVLSAAVGLVLWPGSTRGFE